MATILVVPNGIVVSVAFTSVTGSSVTVYSDEAYQTQVTQPASISAATTYYTQTLGAVRVVASDREGTALADKWVDTRKSGAFVDVAPERSYLSRLANLRPGANSVIARVGSAAAAPVTLAEGTLLGRATGGNVAALTAAEVATILSTSSASTIGNLLTANQSTPATGQLTLSGCTEATGLILTASGSGAYTALVSGVAVTVGQVYTVSASLAPTGRAAAVRISWRNAGGSEVSAVAGDTIAAGATGTSMAVGVAPATAVTMYAYAAYASTGSAGDAVTVTEFGAWAGAGGLWSPPGVPITGTGRRTTHPSTDDVLVEAWDSTQGRWQVAHYDSGWRLVACNSGWSGSVYVRRIDSLVEVTFYNVSGGSGAFVTLPVGFQHGPSSGSNRVVPITITILEVGAVMLSAGAITGYGSALSYSGAYLAVSYVTSDAIPTSLPGTLTSSAPYN